MKRVRKKLLFFCLMAALLLVFHTSVSAAQERVTSYSGIITATVYKVNDVGEAEAPKGPAFIPLQKENGDGVGMGLVLFGNSILIEFNNILGDTELYMTLEDPTSAYNKIAVKINSTYISLGEVIFTKADPDIGWNPMTGVLSINTQAGIDKWNQYSAQAKSKLKSATFKDDSDIKSIPANTFENCSELTSLEFPPSLDRIEEKAFNGCEKLNSVTFKSENAPYIGEDAFKMVADIGSISYPEESSGYNKEFGEKFPIGWAFDFAEDTKPASAETPKINRQPQGADYKKDDKVTTLQVEASVTDGGTLSYQWYKNASDNVTGGTKIVGADSASYTPSAAIAGTTYFYVVVTNTKDTEKASITSSTAKITVNPVLNENTDVNTDTKTVPKKGTKFTAGIYTYMITDAKTNGSGSVTLIGFAKGRSATNVTVPRTASYNGISYKVTAVGTKAFYKNKKVRTVTVGNNVTKIGNRAFSYCPKLTTATIGNSVKTIASLAFYQDSKLKKITIGTGLEKIGEHVFCHDTKLRTLTIKSKNLKTVGKHSLHKTKNMKIKVPSSKVKAYKKLFKGKGQPKSVKVTK